MKNAVIAQVFYDIADILEMQDVDFKPQAYRKAARSIESLTADIEELYKRGGLKALKDIPGVGENISLKIEELLKTGRLEYYEKLKKQIPTHLVELMQVPGMGAKRAKLLHEKLKISSIPDLKKAAEQKKISTLFGFGQKSEEDILKGVELVQKGRERMLLGTALPIAREIEARLKKLKEVSKIELAGSLARRKETIGDLDILVISKKPAAVMDFFTKMKEVDRVLAKGQTKSSILLDSGLQIDLRIVPDESFGAALQYFIGSKDHNIKLRGIAIKKGYKLSEYGLFSKKTNKMVAGSTEQEIYKKLGMQWMGPELRENTGEIEAAIKNQLPKIIEYGSIKGDLHVHTKHSDGANTIEEMALAAKKMGYEYICISDHTKSERIAHGQTEEQVLAEINEIKKVNKKIKGIRILTGAEVDILGDGSLDLDDSVLKKLDVVTVSVHSRFKSPKKEMTARIVKALENKYVDVLDHPTGRLINQRAPYEVDMQQVFAVAKEKKVCLEINSFPTRLDLNDVNVKAAIEAGCKLVISTDSHNTNHLRYIELGIATARRGWAEKKDVANAHSLKELPKFLKRINLS